MPFTPVANIYFLSLTESSTGNIVYINPQLIEAVTQNPYNAAATNVTTSQGRVSVNETISAIAGKLSALFGLQVA